MKNFVKKSIKLILSVITYILWLFSIVVLCTAKSKVDLFFEYRIIGLILFLLFIQYIYYKILEAYNGIVNIIFYYILTIIPQTFVALFLIGQILGNDYINYVNIVGSILIVFINNIYIFLKIFFVKEED